MEFNLKDESESMSQREIQPKESKKEIPRRCVTIRRTFPSPDCEKTEMRFVVYKDPTDKFDQKTFLDEVTQFLQSQSDEMKVHPVESSIHVRSTTSHTTETTVSTTAVPSIAQHKPNCRQTKALKDAISLIKDLIAYFKKLERKTKRKEIEAMRITAENVLVDAQRAVDEGRPGCKTLFHRIKELNRMSEKLMTNNSISFSSSVMANSGSDSDDKSHRKK